MIESRITIKAPVNEVWKALTKKDQMKEWYFDIPDFELTVGSTFNFFEPGKNQEFHHRCVIKDLELNKKLVYTWTYPNHSQGESVISWTLAENNDTTTVVLRHDGLENLSDGGPVFDADNFQKGWNGFMASLKNYIYGMRKHQYEISINASADKVWNVLWGDDTYTEWTEPFCQGSFFKGELKEGNRIHFLSPELGGMYSDIIFFTPSKIALFQHIGEVKDGEELPLDEKAEQWTGSFEKYELFEKDGNTVLMAEIDLVPDHSDYFDQTFPKGLEKVKALAESN